MRLPLVIVGLFLVVLLAFAGGSVALADSRSGLTTADRAAQVGVATQIYWIDAGMGTIRRANSDGSGAIEDLITSGQPTSLAIDLDAGKLYWTDTEAGKIKWADLNDFSNHHDLYRSERPTNLALDTVSGKLYWTDQVPGSIRRANADGTSPSADTLVLEGEPTSLALDPANRDLYWTDGATGKIRRAKMDRSIPDPIFDLAIDLIWPDNLALDLAQGQMYWTEWARGKIRRANLPVAGNSSIENLVDFTSGLPTGLALDLAGGRMYWTNGITHTIQSSDLTGTDFAVADVFSASDGLNAPEGIALPTGKGSAPHLYWVDEEAQKIQRTGTDDYRVVEDLLTAAHGLKMPGSIALDPLAGKMYWTDDGAEGKSDGKIRRVNLDGTGEIDDIFSGLRDPVGIALDLEAGQLYWADRGQGKIYRLNLSDIINGILRTGQDGQAQYETLVSGLTEPYQIALDTANDHMYWTEREREQGEGKDRSKIRRADLDGRNVTDIVFEYPKAAPQNPFGLAIDPVAGKMYWTERNGGGDSIRSADLDGQNGAILVNSAPYSLSGIAVDVNDGKIYWTDKVAGTIRRIDPADPNPADTVEDVVTGLGAPEGIAVARPYLSSTRLALTALYRATDGDNWRDNTNWLSDKLPREWHGIDTDGKQGLIERLDLSGNGLSGELPATLGNLNNLRTLNLSDNELTGAIPTEWADGFEVLKDLNLSHNQLSGEIPAGLGNHHLDTLNLSGNQLAGPIPEAFGSLVRLTELNLSHNELSGAIPWQISGFDGLAKCETIWGIELTGLTLAEFKAYAGTLTNLEVLDLSNNALSGAIPPTLCSLANLEILDLGHNGLHGTIPAELGKLAGLRALYLDAQDHFRANPPPNAFEQQRQYQNDSNYLHGPVPTELGNLAKLEVLDLSENRLSESIPTALANLDNLKLLNLSRNKLTGHIPPNLGNSAANFTNLEVLNLSGNTLDGSIPVALSQLTKLDVLDLSGNRLSGTMPWQLGQLGQLEWLDLSDNKLTGRLPRLGWLTSLEMLDLSNNSLQGDIPPGLGSLYSLRVLSLSGNLFSECLPQWLQTKLQNIEESDFDQLGLSVCATPTTPAPTEADLDRHALVALYSSTDGDNWYNSQRNNAKWQVDDPDSPIGEWYGVTTNAQGRVTKIDLLGNNLNGELPEELTSLDDYTALNFLANELSGCIPFGLQEEQLKGPYDATLDTFAEQLGTATEDFIATSAAVAFAAFTFLAHELEGINRDWGGWRAFAEESYGLGLPPCPPPPTRPEGWTARQTSKTDAMALLAIRKYYVDDHDNQPNAVNKFDADGGWTEAFEDYATSVASEDCPDDSPFKTIDRLWPLPHATIHGVETRKIDGCHRVIALHLDKRGLHGGIPSAIGRLGELEVLNLSRNATFDREHGGLSGEVPPELGNLTNLVKLSLNDNQLAGNLPAQLGHLNNLKFLALNENEFTGGMPRALGNLSDIEHLKLSDSGLTGCIPPPIRQNVAPSLLSLGNLAVLPAKTLQWGGKKTASPLLNFVANLADKWGGWWKTKKAEGAIEKAAAAAADLIVPDASKHANAAPVRKAIAGAIGKVAGKSGDAIMGLVIGLFLTAAEDLGSAFNFVSGLLAPIDYIFKPGSTAGWTSLGGVSLNCAALH